MGTRKTNAIPAVVLIAVVLLMMLSLSGCGLGGATTSETDPTQTDPTDIAVPSTVDFGTVKIGASKTVPFTLSNPAKDSTTITKVDISGSAFKVSNLTLPMTLASGATYSATAEFTPTVSGTNSGTVTVTTDKSNGNGKKIGLNGNGGMAKLDANPTAVSFGTVAVGKTSTKAVTVSNSGNMTLTISSASVSSTAFAISGWTFPVTIAAGSSKSLNVAFSPKATGSASGSVSFTSDANGGTASLSMTGTAANPGVLGASPGSFQFGNVNVGSSATSTTTLSNSGGMPVVITAISGTSEVFPVSGLTLPATINPGASATVTLKFVPSAIGAASSSIGFTNDTNALAVAVNGTGVAPQAAISPASLSFGSINVGASSTKPLTLSNTGTANLSVTQIATSGAGFSVTGFTLPLTIAPGQSVAGSVKFAPTTAGSVTGSITVTSNTLASVSAVTLSGTGVAIAPVATPSPTSIAFGNVLKGASSTQALSIRNSGTADLAISQISMTGSAAYSVSGFTIPMTLTPGQSASGSVKFSPTAAGAATGSVNITSNAAPVSVSLSGTGTQPQLAMSPASVSFGNVNTGSTASQALTLTNNGSANLSVSQLAVTGTGFSVTGFTLPMTLTPGQSMAGSVRFAPTTGGSVTGSVTATSDSATAVSPVSISGTGVAPSPQLAVTPTSIAFGSVTTGQSSTQALTLRNSGTADLSISQLTVSGAGYSVSGFILPLTLTPGQTASGSVKFAPTSAGSVTGSVTVTSNSASAVPPVALSGTGAAATPQISVTPTSMAFGNVTTGTTDSTPLTLRNSGTANLNITAVTASGTGYSVNGFILPLTLAPGASAVGNVVFAPTTTGAMNGTVTTTSNSSTAAPTVALSGTGVAPTTFLLSASPTSLSFGTVVVGTSKNLTVTLSNTGTGSLSLSAANVTGTGYSVTGVTFPVSIAAGATRSVTVVFTPQLAGTANGSVAFVSNATNSPASVTTTGSGQNPLPHSVDVSWTASTSTVVGYNVYRGSATGGPYTKLTSSPQVGATYTDDTVQAGTSYFYVVRAVNATGVESGNSNEASAAVPIP